MASSSLPPLGSKPPAFSGSGPAKTPKSSRGTSALGAEGESREATRAAMQMQREASQQIAATTKAVQEARREADSQIDEIRDQYEVRADAAAAREEEAYNSQRQNGYERLKDLKRNQEAELHRVRREGERDIAKLSHYYMDTAYKTERAGDQKLQEIKSQQAGQLGYAERLKDDDVKAAQETYQRQAAEVREGTEERLARLTAEAAKDYERIRGQSVEATAKADESYTEKYNNRVRESARTLGALEQRAADGIREIRRDTSQKLAAYSSRQSDPFYRMLDLNADLEDAGDHYVFTATIPQHEQHHVSVAVKGNQLVMTGYRRSEEKLEIEPGRTQGTNAFQSFLETFPIAWPVDAKKMTREFEGDQLTVRIPKKNDFAYRSQAEEKVKVARARLERPKFPDNLPHVSQDPYADPPAGPVDPLKKTKSSGTLA
jgi:HSP20 family molecular chaperone IbpA